MGHDVDPSEPEAVHREPFALAHLEVSSCRACTGGPPGYVLVMNDRRHLVCGAVAAAVGELVNYVIASFTYRARPFVAMPHLVHLLVHHGADSSFPSDHATAVFAVANPSQCHLSTLLN
jgi:membrane-associated phospholipid phosphatase